LSKPEPAPEPAVAAEVKPEIAVDPVRTPKPKSRFWKCLGWTVLILIIIAAVLSGAFYAVSRISPELLDSILYSKEELEILNYKL
jgi:hypothetical protein